MSSLGLEALFSDCATLTWQGRTFRREEVEERREPLRWEAHLEDGAVVRIPTDDPVQLLADLAEAWRRRLCPLPDGEVRAPTATGVPGRGAVLAIKTSGTTGEAKWCGFSARAVAWSLSAISVSQGLTPTDRVAVLQPLHHAFGLTGQLLASLAAGCQVHVALSPFPAERLRLLEECSPTVLSAVPYHLQRLVEDVGALPDLRLIGSAGGALTTALAHRWLKRFPDARFLNQYGCTEAGPRLCVVSSREEAFWKGSVGRPLPGVRVWCAEEGQVRFCSPGAMLGYLNAPGEDAAGAQARSAQPGAGEGGACAEVEAARSLSCETKAGVDEGLATGDLGFLDPEGFLFLEGRGDGVAKLRGDKVSLHALELALRTAGAAEAVALVEPLPQGEQLVALYEAASALDLHVLRALPPLLRPARCIHVPVLPRTRNGKLDRTAVLALLKEAT